MRYFKEYNIKTGIVQILQATFNFRVKYYLSVTNFYTFIEFNYSTKLNVNTINIRELGISCWNFQKYVL